MKVLLAYDGFDHSQAALEEVAGFAGDAEILVLSVVPPDAAGSKAGGHVGMAPHAHEDVARAHAFLRERGIDSEMRISHGDPVEEILAAAKEQGTELIVVGTRGRGPVGRLLLGSVSHALSERATCPVVVVGTERTVRVEPKRP